MGYPSALGRVTSGARWPVRNAVRSMPLARSCAVAFSMMEIRSGAARVEKPALNSASWWDKVLVVMMAISCGGGEMNGSAAQSACRCLCR